MEILKKNLGSCDHALLINGAPKSSTVYIVKLPEVFFRKIRDFL